MSSSGLFAEIRKHPKILAVVILLHLGVIVMLSINLARDDKPPMPKAQKHKIINAVAVNTKKYDERKKQKILTEQKKLEDKKRQQALEQKKAEEKKLAIKKQAEQKRQAEKKKAQEVEKQKKLAIAKKKEQERLKKEKLKKEQLKKEKLEKEKLEKERLAKEKKEKERKAREKKEKERLAAERRKKEEERKRRAEEKAEFERALLEEERREEEARKQVERAARLQTQREQYIMQIAQKVENNWLRPVTKTEGQSCDVVVTQTMMGDVIDVRLKSCTSDNAFQRSVERAVRKASPLPMPPNPDVYDREIYFTFKPR